MKDLLRISNHRGLWLKVLGEVGRHQIWFLRSKETLNSGNRKLLIAAGFHGEERAGPLAILKWLEECDGKIFEKMDLSFLPVTNPIGFNRGIRYNTWNEKTNGGFYHTKRNKDKPSHEGEILIRNIDLLKESAADGFLSLHEDTTSDEFYIYIYSHRKSWRALAEEMRNEEAKFFNQPLDGVHVNEEGDPHVLAHDGLVHNLHDGSFEDWLMHLGVPYAVVTDTPGKTRIISKRVEAGVALINKFIELRAHGRK
jgi:hypothetical protein